MNTAEAPTRGPGHTCRWAERDEQGLPDGCEWVFVPALIDVLARVEMDRGVPLSEAEVHRIKEGATVIAVPEGGRDSAAKERGYPDVDPENVWTYWQKVREALGANPKPELTWAQRVGTFILRLIGRR